MTKQANQLTYQVVINKNKHGDARTHQQSDTRTQNAVNYPAQLRPVVRRHFVTSWRPHCCDWTVRTSHRVFTSVRCTWVPKALRKLPPGTYVSRSRWREKVPCVKINIGSLKRKTFDKLHTNPSHFLQSNSTHPSSVPSLPVCFWASNL